MIVWDSFRRVCERSGYVTASVVAVAVPIVAAMSSSLPAEIKAGLAMAAWAPTFLLFVATITHPRVGSAPAQNDSSAFTRNFGFSSGGPLLATLRIVLFGELWAMVFIFRENSPEFYLAAAGFATIVLLTMKKLWDAVE